MREYIQPGFAQQQKQREVDKLDAIRQALNNCHRSLSTIGGGEEAFLARQDIASAYQQVATLRKEKARHLEAAPAMTITTVDVDAEEWDD